MIQVPGLFVGHELRLGRTWEVVDPPTLPVRRLPSVWSRDRSQPFLPSPPPPLPTSPSSSQPPPSPPSSPLSSPPQPVPPLSPLPPPLPTLPSLSLDPPVARVWCRTQGPQVRYRHRCRRLTVPLPPRSCPALPPVVFHSSVRGHSCPPSASRLPRILRHPTVPTDDGHTCRVGLSHESLQYNHRIPETPS